MSSGYRYWKPHEDVVPPPPPPPPPIPEVAVGVRVYPTIPKARYALWRREIREWWRDYFRDVGLLGPEEDEEELISRMMVDHEINVDEDDEELINLL